MTSVISYLPIPEIMVGCYIIIAVVYAFSGWGWWSLVWPIATILAGLPMEKEEK